MDSRCEPCGARLFAGADWCSQCFAPARQTAAVATLTRPTWPQSDFSTGTVPVEKYDPELAPAPTAPRTDVDSSVFRTAFGVVVLGAVVAIGMYLWGRSADLEPSRMIRDGLFVNIGLYVLVMALVVERVRKVEFRPIWTDGDGTESLLVGLLVGGGLATGLLLLSRLATGRVVTDANIEMIVSEKTVVRIVAAFLIACVAAPWVEELLFRGLVTESLRPWGLKPAVFGSGALFAIWHPQALFPLLDGMFGGGGGGYVPFLYYLSMGALFGRLYLKRGLKCSIAAHTAFNGLIVVTALAVSAGPSHVITSEGVSARVPATWHLADADELGPLQGFAADGPSGAGMVVMRVPIPPGAVVTADMAAANLAQGSPFPEATIDRDSIRIVDYPMGQSVRVGAQMDGHDAEVVVVPTAEAVWQVILVSGGSARAEADFDEILRTVVLPAAA